MNAQPISPSLWPELPLEAWKDTYATLHMWTQIVGKVRLAPKSKNQSLVGSSAVRYLIAGSRLLPSHMTVGFLRFSSISSITGC